MTMTRRTIRRSDRMSRAPAIVPGAMFAIGAADSLFRHHEHLNAVVHLIELMPVSCWPAPARADEAGCAQTSPRRPRFPYPPRGVLGGGRLQGCALSVSNLSLCTLGEDRPQRRQCLLTLADAQPASAATRALAAYRRTGRWQVGCRRRTSSARKSCSYTLPVRRSR